MNTNEAAVRTTVIGKINGEERSKVMVDDNEIVDIPIGDGNAQVTITRGSKRWESVHNARGITVEASATVTLRCGQTVDEIRDAELTAADLASEFAAEGEKEMNSAIEDYLMGES